LAADLGMYVGPSLEKKRDGKAAGKQHEQIEKESVKSGVSRVSNKSFGNALKGAPGTLFVVNGISFTVLNEKDAKGNRMVQCQCEDKMRRDNTKRHTERNH